MGWMEAERKPSFSMVCLLDSELKRYLQASGQSKILNLILATSLRNDNGKYLQELYLFL